jgi:hypothetical protein
VAGEDLDSSLIVPLIKCAEPEGAGGSSAPSWPQGDTPIAEELAGELYVFYGFDLPGAFRLVSRRDCARMQLDAGDLRPLRQGRGVVDEHDDRLGGVGELAVEPLVGVTPS